MLLELRFSASLLGGMFSMSSADDDDDNFHRAVEDTPPLNSGLAPEYKNPAEYLDS